MFQNIRVATSAVLIQFRAVFGLALDNVTFFDQSLAVAALYAVQWLLAGYGQLSD